MMGPRATTKSEIAVATLAPQWAKAIPRVSARARRVAKAALVGAAGDGRSLPQRAQLSLALADDALLRRLNRDYRKKDKPTNVLSFPAGLPKKSALHLAAVHSRQEPTYPTLLGDVVVAFETVAQEAAAQGKTLADHLSHLIVHGTLHLLGYDHEEPEEAARMERLEALVLAGLGIADPYRGDRVACFKGARSDEMATGARQTQSRARKKKPYARGFLSGRG